MQLVVSDAYAQQAQAARTTSIEMEARRGTIYDRNGIVLAKSIDATTIYVNPYEVTDVKGQAAQLAAILGGEAPDYEEKLSQDDKTFVYIKRKADVDQAEQVKDLDLDGIYFLEDTKRVYPNNEVGGQVVGFVNIDGEGVSGLELYYDEILRGNPGTLVVERGVHGIPIPGGVHQDTPTVNGQDIIVSLDVGMQEKLEESLTEGIAAIGSEGGNAILADAQTGEIYAAASLPLFNPSDTSEYVEGSEQLRGITSAFEPGSIFKAVPMLALLEEGIITPEDEIFCPAVLNVDEYKITDAHERADQTMTMRQVLNQSSNVGVSLATEKLGFNQLYLKILNYNLCKETGVDYPGEASGYLLEQEKWSKTQSYNVSFGQGVSLTPLQMVQFYGTLANNGVQQTPHFLMKKVDAEDQPEWKSQEIISNKEAVNTINSMLTTVVTEGTGTDAIIEGYTVAGKTGTAEIADPELGYLKGVYNISFVGYLPNSSSSLVCFVGATEVPYERKMVGTFKDIMEFAIDRYKILPDEG